MSSVVDPSAVAGSRPARNLSPWAHAQLELATTATAESVPSTPTAVPDWRSRTRARLTELLGRFPRPVALDAEVTERTDCGTYSRERVVFDTEEHMSVPAYLLVPHARSRPGPAVLAIHGHGPGKDDVAGVGADGAVDAHPGAYAHRLAAAGHLVLAPDLRCFGERADWAPPDRYLCDANLVAATAAGRHPLTDNLHDLVGALDLLEDHPLVDPSRLAAVGFSYGGTMSLFLAAWDTRVRATIVSGYFSSLLAAHRVPYNLCGSQVLPGMLGRIDHVDLGALVAPRALLVESGTGDLIFPVDAARASVASLSTVYRAMHAPAEALVHHVFEGDHRWDGGSALAFLERWL